MKVAIFGAGTMGSGIAQVFAAKGHTALMFASSPASAQKHKDKLEASLAKRVAKGKMTQEALDALMANILVDRIQLKILISLELQFSMKCVIQTFSRYLILHRFH